MRPSIRPLTDIKSEWKWKHLSRQEVLVWGRERESAFQCVSLPSTAAGERSFHKILDVLVSVGRRLCHLYLSVPPSFSFLLKWWYNELVWRLIFLVAITQTSSSSVRAHLQGISSRVGVRVVVVVEGERERRTRDSVKGDLRRILHSYQRIHRLSSCIFFVESQFHAWRESSRASIPPPEILSAEGKFRMIYRQ